MLFAKNFERLAACAGGLPHIKQFNADHSNKSLPFAHARTAKTEVTIMAEEFKVGDHVTWNSEAGHVSGKIIKVHRKDVDYKGHMHRASKDDPQYEIKSSKTDHIAMRAVLLLPAQDEPVALGRRLNRTRDQD